MKQLGNLAIICAQRTDTSIQVVDGVVTVHIGRGPERAIFTADWRADDKIYDFILELNHGQFKEKNMYKTAKSA